MKSFYANGESFNNDDIEGWGSLGDVTAWFYVYYQFIFFFLNYISYMSTSPSSHHYHFINNIYFFPCCILGIVLPQCLTFIYKFYYE